jgi:hypothetical protein
LTVALARSDPPEPASSSNESGPVCPAGDHVAVAVDADGGGAELDVVGPEHLGVDRLDDAGLVVVAELHHAAGPLEHAQRRAVGPQRQGRALAGELERRIPVADLDQQVVPGPRDRAGATGPHPQRAVCRTQLECLSRGHSRGL